MLQCGAAEGVASSYLPRGRKHVRDPRTAGESVRIGDMEIRSHLFESCASEVPRKLHVGETSSLVLLTEGGARLSRGGKHVTLSAGEWTIAYGDIFTVAEQRARLVIVQLGRDFSLQSAEQLRPFLLRPYGEACGADRIVYLHAVGMIEMDHEVSVGVGQELAAITAHLIRVALTQASAGRPLASMRDTLRLRIRTYIERNLHDPGLSIDSIATRFKCSKRNLHKVFQEEGDTLNRFLWSTRLERCRVDLEDPILRHRSITEIAFNWGFNSSAHFSRAFRARFGVTPRDIRG